MRSEPEDFDSIRRLLALKRHEVPPPGFFEAFPNAVRARIRAEQAKPELPWWHRRFNSFQWWSALAGACAIALGSVVVWHAGVDVGQTSRLPRYPSLAEGGPAPAPHHLTTLPVLQPVEGIVDAGQPTSSGSSSMSPLVGAPAPSWLFSPGAGMRGIAQRASIDVPPTMTTTGSLDEVIPRPVSTNAP